MAEIESLANDFHKGSSFVYIATFRMLFAVASETTSSASGQVTTLINVGQCKLMLFPWKVNAHIQTFAPLIECLKVTTFVCALVISYNNYYPFVH